MVDFDARVVADAICAAWDDGSPLAGGDADTIASFAIRRMRSFDRRVKRSAGRPDRVDDLGKGLAQHFGHANDWSTPLKKDLRHLAAKIIDAADGHLIAQAILAGDLNPISSLLELAPNLSEPITPSGWPALRLAAEHQRSGIVSALLVSGAPVGQQSGLGGWSALHQAVDADIDATVQLGAPAIDWRTTAALLAGGADPELPAGGDGLTAFGLAREYGDSAALSLERLVAAMQRSAYWNANRIIDELDNIYDQRPGSESALLQTLHDHRYRIAVPLVQTLIDQALQDVARLLRTEPSPEALNHKVLFDTDDLRLACAAIDPDKT